MFPQKIGAPGDGGLLIPVSCLFCGKGWAAAWPSWPYKKSNIPFETALFADCGSERQILLNIQKQVSASATRLELPIDCPEAGSDVDSDADVESDDVSSGSSESD